MEKAQCSTLHNVMCKGRCEQDSMRGIPLAQTYSWSGSCVFINHAGIKRKKKWPPSNMCLTQLARSARLGALGFCRMLRLLPLAAASAWHLGRGLQARFHLSSRHLRWWVAAGVAARFRSSTSRPESRVVFVAIDSSRFLDRVGFSVKADDSWVGVSCTS